MARRRKKEKSIIEPIAGLVVMLVAFGVLSPVFRQNLFSLGMTMLSVVILAGIAGFIFYILILSREKEPVPVKLTKQNPDLTKQAPQLIPADLSPEEQVRLQRVLESMVPKIYSSSPRPENWDISVLRAIEWKRFETLTKEFLAMTGYHAQETKIGADGGVDIRVCKPGTDGWEGIVQCKAWNTYKVGVKPVRELYGVMAAEKVSRGMLITSGDFTTEALDFAKGKFLLVSGAQFLEHIGKLSAENQKKLLNLALEGDYKTPTCPQCDVKMVVRDSKRGRNIGGQFWGCVNYPRCRQTLIYKPEE